MNQVFLLSVVVLALTSSSYGAKSIASFITLCKRNDPNLNKCFGTQLKNVLSNMDNGIPQMNLRKINPLLVEKVNFEVGNTSALTLNSNLTEMKIYGFGAANPTSVDIDLEKVIFKMNITIPELRLESFYKAKGTVLAINFDSEGTVLGSCANINTFGVWSGKKFMKNGKEHFKIVKGDLNFDVKDIKVQIDNLFRNNIELTKVTNQGINENINELFEILKPIVLEIFNSVVIDLMNQVNDLFSIDELFPKD